VRKNAALVPPQDHSILRPGVAPKRVDTTWDAVSGRVLSTGVHAHTQVTSRPSAVPQPPGLRGGGATGREEEERVEMYEQKLQIAELLLQEHIACRKL
jgi:hypothetical protein